MGELGNENRDALFELLQDEEIQKDIGVANYLIATYGEGASLPGDILNWAIRFDIETLVEAKTSLQALADEYNYIYKAPLSPLEDSWKGKGATAFVGRWEELQAHVSVDQGLAHYLEKLTDDLNDLIKGAHTFQKDCYRAVDEKLKGLRKQYCEALIAYSNNEGGNAADTFASYAGTGAGIGSVGGPWGIAIGSLLGGLIGAVSGFSEHVEKGAEKELAKVDTAGDLKDQLDEKESSFTGQIDGDSQYSRGGGETTKWDPQDRTDDWDEEWETAS